MSIHYKFKSNLNFDTLTFDGLHISVGDLKKAIIHQKKLGKVIDYDLQITNAQTKEEYSNDSHLIPKNTSLIISRVPISSTAKKHCETDEYEHQSRYENKIVGKTLDLTRLNGSEEDKIQEMMLQSTVQYDPKSYQKFRSQSQTGEVPSTYKCNKCKRGGHWIKNCPLSNAKELIEVKRNTGIPRSFRDKGEKQLEIHQAEFLLPKEEKKIPDDLICSICKDLFVDAVMIPCCGSSFCDDCVRTALLESEDNECPDCKEKGSSPGALIPNRFLRNSVNAFRNENGYIPENKIKIICESSADRNPIAENNIPAIENIKNLQSNDNEETDHITPDPKSDVGNSKSEDVESDFEDNIIVKVPVLETKNGLNDACDQSKNIECVTQKPTPLVDANNILVNSLRQEDVIAAHSKPEMKKTSIIENIPINSQRCDVQDRRMLPDARMNNFQQFHIYPQVPQYPGHRGQSHGGFDNFFNRSNIRPPLGYSNMVHPPINDLCPGYLPIRPPTMDIQKTSNFSTFSNIYDGITAKLGSGIIDDPLEAFNRIMKEKEKEKEQKRRNIQRRSRSKERQQRRQFRSPSYERRNSKQLNLKETRLHRKRHIDTKYGHKYQRSNSAAHSRSRSRSPLQTRLRSSPIESRQSQYHRNTKNIDNKILTEPSEKKHIHFMHRSSVRQRDNVMDDFEPPPPGSDVLHFDKKRKSRTRSSSFNRDDKIFKNKPKNKNSPNKELTSVNRDDVHHYTPEPMDIIVSDDLIRKSDNFTPIKSKDVVALISSNVKEIKNSVNSIDKPEDMDKSEILNESDVIKKDTLKTEKKNKDRKKKKKDKDKLLKRKNKKEKKEKRSSDKNKDGSKPLKQNEEERRKNDTENRSKTENNESKSSNVGQILKSKCEVVKETSPKELKTSDSILDIQGYDTDFEDIVNHEKKNSANDLFNNDKKKHTKTPETVIVKDLRKSDSHHNNKGGDESLKKRSSPKAIKSIKERLGSKVVSNFDDTFSYFKPDVVQGENRTSYDTKNESIAWRQLKGREKWNSHNISKQKSPPPDYIFKNNSKSEKNVYHSRPKFQLPKRECNSYSQNNDMKSVASRYSSERRPENPFRNKSIEYKISSNSHNHAIKRMNSSHASSDDTYSDASDLDGNKKLKMKKKNKKRKSSLSQDTDDSGKHKNSKPKKKHKIVKKKKKSKD